MANIAIAKLAKSIRFDQAQWSSVGGVNEAPFLIYALAKTFPEDTFWIIGKSDYSKVFPNGLLPNIKDIWSKEYWETEKSPTSYLNSYSYDENPELYKSFYRYVNRTFDKLNVTIDFAIILYGIFFSCSMYETVLNTDGKYTKSLECSTKRMSFLTYWLNTYKGKYVSIVTDPRQYAKMPRDFVHWADINLSQIDKDMQFTEKSTQYWPAGQIIENPQRLHKNIYSGVETITLFSAVPYDSFPKKKGFNMILNQGFPASSSKQEPPRYTELKKWILSDADFDCSIYGNWDDKILSSDKRFRGPVQQTELGSVLETTKYTLCIPIAPGWVTSKFVEMAHYGVLPFVTDTYGTESSQTYIPDVLRVKSQAELKERIAMFEACPDAYDKVMQYLKHLLKNMYSGEYALTHICNNIKNYTGFSFGKKIAFDKPLALLYKEDVAKSKITTDIDDLF